MFVLNLPGSVFYMWLIVFSLFSLEALLESWLACILGSGKQYIENILFEIILTIVFDIMRFLFFWSFRFFAWSWLFNLLLGVTVASVSQRSALMTYLFDTQFETFYFLTIKICASLVDDLYIDFRFQLRLFAKAWASHCRNLRLSFLTMIFVFFVRQKLLAFRISIA